MKVVVASRRLNARPMVRRLRQWAEILRREGELPTSNKLGKRYEWSYKTVYRDLEMMRDFWGWPIKYDKAEYKWKLAGQPPEPVL
jgi:predicted DNA-binding transcriptional regulator YafY